MNARDLYSSKMKTVLMAIVIMEVNQRPSLNGTDSDSDALRERLLDFLFESKFTAKTGDEVDELNLVFKQNAYYKTIEFQESHRCALFQYLINYDSG